MTSPTNLYYKGWWTYPYYSCTVRKWLISYSVPILTAGQHGYVKMQFLNYCIYYHSNFSRLKRFLSLDVDVSTLEINQCENYEKPSSLNEITSFHGSHKCDNTTSKVIVFNSKIYKW